ncbi:PilW family protein [Acinetobacter pittii]|uniref:PilW family protein n=1 Tax=Acinetobacter pittii TaxID=48296 RepID=UPI000CE4B3CE|nr:PilW family protein [Acinetobacter pittii]PPC05530.1 pilus assembly protein PilW [Acinetobacter pittii]WPP59703.1 PilW family protein [Acinetobacter pittii]
MKNQYGFTLIELMLSLTLGLIITAAAILLFFTGQKSLTLQHGATDLQDNANFGLNYIVKDIRLANLDASRAFMNDQTTYGGVVLTSTANAFIDTLNGNTKIANLPNSILEAKVPLTLLTQSDGDSVGTAPAWAGASNVNDFTSDQLVIQFAPTEIGGFDCEGQSINTTNNYIVERYFLRVDTRALTSESNKALALACDSGHYPKSGSPTEITDFGDAGQIIMKRVDYFRVLLGIDIGNGQYRYISSHDYLTNYASPRPRILSVQLGMLTRSTQSVGRDTAIKDNQTFNVLDRTVTVKTPQSNSPKYIRQVISQTIALRNGFGSR